MVIPAQFALSKQTGHKIVSCFTTIKIIGNKKENSQMSIARVTEIKSSSTKSFDDAIKSGIARAQKTLTQVQSAWIENQEVLLNGKGLIAEYRVQMKVTFILEE
jgi:dodecin